MSVEFLDLYRPDAESTRKELADGLMAPQAQIAPKFFYDALGSRLFEAITELPEYYPTRVEAQIFAEHGEAIAELAGTGRTLIDLGAGSCAKAQSLMPLLKPSQYAAIDVASEFVREALVRIERAYPDLPLLGVGMDFSSALNLPEAVNGEKRLFFYPGSSIGNFSPEGAQRFLGQIAEAAGPRGALLIGADLRKDKATLEAAYDDAIGVTAAFNKNLLLNVNRWLGANFDPKLWRHVALFDERHSRIEMHLEAKQAQALKWPGGQRTFNKGQRIHTENSYKYTVEGFDAMLTQAGFARREFFTDAKQAFGVWLAFR